MHTIPFDRIADAPAFPEEYSLVTRSVAGDGSLLFLFVELGGEEAVVKTDQRTSGIFPCARMDEPKRFRLVKVGDNGSHVLDLPPLDVTFPLVDVFPSGKVLLAGPRCQWRGEGDYDLNGVVYDPANGGTSRILLGDGIARIYVDERGYIWVSYFDEGIFGNYGWGGRSGPEPIGAAGLACFSEAGEKVWEFPGSMADCYALNVSGSEAVAYYYVDFPICRISGDFRVTHWKTNLEGCSALAVTQSKALLSGQYKDSPTIGYLGFLDGDGLKNVKKVRLALPDGSETAKYDLLGRGPHLYCFDVSGVYRATLT